MNKSTLIVVDFDDTLISSALTLIPFYQRILKERCFGFVEAQSWRDNWGKILEEVVAACYPHLDAKQVERACSHIRQGAKTFKVPSVIGGPSAIDLLRQQFRLGLLTSRGHFTEELLASAGYSLQHFNFIITQQNGTPAKPEKQAADPIFYWTQNNDVAEWIYVGDSLIDLEFAKNVGVPFFAVTTGLTDAQAFLTAGQPAELIFSSIVEAADYLLKEEIITCPGCRGCEECRQNSNRVKF